MILAGFPEDWFYRLYLQYREDGPNKRGSGGKVVSLTDIIVTPT